MFWYIYVLEHANLEISVLGYKLVIKMSNDRICISNATKGAQAEKSRAPPTAHCYEALPRPFIAMLGNGSLLPVPVKRFTSKTVLRIAMGNG